MTEGSRRLTNGAGPADGKTGKPGNQEHGGAGRLARCGKEAGGSRAGSWSGVVGRCAGLDAGRRRGGRGRRSFVELFRCSKALLLDLWSRATGHARRGSPSAGPHWLAPPHVIRQPRARPWFGGRDLTSTTANAALSTKKHEELGVCCCVGHPSNGFHRGATKTHQSDPAHSFPRQRTCPTGTLTDDDGAWRPELARKLLAQWMSQHMVDAASIWRLPRNGN